MGSDRTTCLRFTWQVKQLYQKQHCIYSSGFVVLFCSDVVAFHSFVGKITAQGGKNGPEDVLGGLKAALNLHWRDGCSRVSLIFLQWSQMCII